MWEARFVLVLREFLELERVLWCFEKLCSRSTRIWSQKPETRKPETRFRQNRQIIFKKIGKILKIFSKNPPKKIWSIFWKICLVHFRSGSRTCENGVFREHWASGSRFTTPLKSCTSKIWPSFWWKSIRFADQKSGFWFPGFWFLWPDLWRSQP